MRTFAQLILLIAAPFALYWSAVHGEFHYDDIHHIVENLAIRDPGNIIRFFHDPSTFSSKPGVEMYRPALMATYMINYSIGGLKPEGWHVFNILLHALNTLLLFSIVLRLLDRKDAAFLAALLFAAHPAAGESVNYISSRSSLLMATFFLSAFLAYQRGTDPGTKRAWAVLAVFNILYLFGLLTKESAVALVPVMFVYEFLFNRRPDRLGKWIRQAAIRLSPAVLITVGYLLLRRVMFDAVLSPFETRPVWTNLLTESKAYFFYLRLLLWPVHLNVDHGFAVEESLLSLKVMLAIAGMAASLLIGITLAAGRDRGGRTLALCMGWYFLALLPTSSIVPLNMLVNERRLYLPLAAFSIAAAFAYTSLRPRAPKVVIGIYALAIIMLGGLVLARNPVWNREGTLWRDAYRKEPENFRTARGLADHYFFDQKLERALGLYRRASELETDKAQTLHNIGLILDMLGKPQEAIDELKRSIGLDPKNARTHFSLSNAYEHVGSIELARFHLEEAILLDPGYALAHNNLGKILFEQGDYPAAEKEYRAALKIEPDNELANFNLGILLNRKGLFHEALPFLRAAFHANPEYPDNAFQLGLCYYRLQKWQEAAFAFRKATQLKPDWKQAWYNLGLAEKILGNEDAANAAFTRSGMKPPENLPETP